MRMERAWEWWKALGGRLAVSNSPLVCMIEVSLTPDLIVRQGSWGLVYGLAVEMLARNVQ